MENEVQMYKVHSSVVFFMSDKVQTQEKISETQNGAG